MNNKANFNQTVLYFNNPRKDLRIHHAQFRGSKVKGRNQNKLYQIKNLHVDRYHDWQIEREQTKESSNLNSTNKHYSLNPLRRKNAIINSSFEAFNSKKQENQENRISFRSKDSLRQSSDQLLRLQSSDLDTRMNEYLNLLMQKTKRDQEQKLRKMLELEYEHKKNTTQNSFVRKMKMHQKKKVKLQQKKDDSINPIARKTIKLLKRKEYGRLPENKLPSFFFKN